jgi:hypothetical protein
VQPHQNEHEYGLGLEAQESARMTNKSIGASNVTHEVNELN